MRYFLCGMLSLVFVSCGSPARKAVRSPQAPSVSQAVMEEPSVRDMGDGWVEAIGDAYLIHITPEEAKRQALENARAEAIRYAAGVQVGSVTYDRQVSLSGSAADREEIRESFATVSEQTSAGKIVEEKPPRWRTYTINDPKSSLPIMVYRAYLGAKVAAEKGELDPDFAMTVKLNKDSFRDGDEMSMRIQASKDCYLTVLNLAANDTVYVLLPHAYRNDPFISGGQAVEVPNAEERAIGIRYRVHMSEGRDTDTEVIKVIATKKRYEFGKGLERAGGFSIVPTPRGALIELQRWLVRIPRHERAEAMAIYDIRPSQ
ncbi:MAG: DUF4384 domain-containing protein [Candidatus Latescibacterota bacterium]